MKLSLGEQQEYLRSEALEGRGKIVELTKGLITLVDAADFEGVRVHKWYAQKARINYYAARRLGRQIILLHRVLVQPPKGLVVDHREHNTLDNRRSFLRLATFQQNSANSKKIAGRTSEYKGVCRVKPIVNATNIWMAYIGGSVSDGARLKRIHLGYFPTEVAAARAADEAAKLHFGEFAILNFP